MATNSTPNGCGPNVDSLYYNLCDLSVAWGITVEAFVTAGVAVCIVLFIALLASLPFVQDRNCRSSLALHFVFLVCTAGLFGLTFAFIVGKDFSTCASRRFLFGVLFAGCFSCMLMQTVRLNILAQKNVSPRAWVLCLGALGLWLVQVIINTEWLIITVARYPLEPLDGVHGGRETSTPCNITKHDFVMGLIYVMTLLLTTLVSSLTVMAGKYNRWKTEAAFIAVTTFLSVCIWVAWIVMYLYGNEQTGGVIMDDPTMAIALVVNAWVFVVFHTIPRLCSLAGDDESQPSFGEDSFANRGVGYETILKETSAQSIFMENKAFSMDEPSKASKPISPYSGYTGQLRSSVYQPTELALISKAAANNPAEPTHDTIIPRASAITTPDSAGVENQSTAYMNGNDQGNSRHGNAEW
ncbi:G-protein coupled receptor family C group 5 member C isoform 1-T2 [Synchiropus picturatus]